MMKILSGLFMLGLICGWSTVVHSHTPPQNCEEGEPCIREYEDLEGRSIVEHGKYRLPLHGNTIEGSTSGVRRRKCLTTEKELYDIKEKCKCCTTNENCEEGEPCIREYEDLEGRSMVEHGKYRLPLHGNTIEGSTSGVRRRECLTTEKELYNIKEKCKCCTTNDANNDEDDNDDYDEEYDNNHYVVGDIIYTKEDYDNYFDEDDNDDHDEEYDNIHERYGDIIYNEDDDKDYDEDDHEGIDCNVYRKRFLCDNGRCIQDLEQCDGSDNCGDWSDEIGCTRTICNVYRKRFLCDNGRCIQDYKLCDGSDDCGEGSDERGCTGSNGPPIKCEYENQLFQHPNQCHKFIQCRDYVPIEITCPYGEAYTRWMRGCMLLHLHNDTECSKNPSKNPFPDNMKEYVGRCSNGNSGNSPHPTNCHKYTLCLDTIKHEITCPEGEAWSQSMNGCLLLTQESYKYTECTGKYSSRSPTLDNAEYKLSLNPPSF